MNIPLNIDWQQILLHLLNFAILAGGLYLLLYKPVKAFMAKREDWYQAQADEAEKTRQEAEALKAAAQAQTDAAAEEAKAIRAKAREDAQEDVRRLKEDAQAQAEKLLSDARVIAENDRKRVMEETEHQVKELVSAAAEKLVLSSDGAALDQFLELAGKGEDGDAS
ncbi:MAG: ATP synthase F0 subunit B [Lachnospiraceae bacterium]|nr:ATP synthase F0 subunit B [Lachnospiraceae bacterium]MDY4965828.1 ATP synthase F0 subunit B [Dysosmobacter sp.]